VPVESGAVDAGALCLVADASGLVWIGTTRGVVRLNRATLRQAHFTTADGLPNNLVTSAARDASGALWFGTPEGVSRLVPAPEAPASAPRAVIAGFRVNGNVRPVPELGTVALTGLTLAPDENRVRVDFASPSFTPGGRILYETRLEGLDTQWSPPNPDPTVRYVGLAPGAYRLAVRAVSPDGLPGPEATASFRVRPPFWRRAEFLVSAIALAGLAAFLVHRQGVRHAVAVERVRTRLATDLHDDVGSSLARISILSEVGRRDLDAASEAARLFEEIGETSRGVIDALGDAIWSIDPRHDDLQSLADRLRHFATDLLEGRGIACRIEVPAGAAAVDLPAEPRRHLFLLLKEAVTNAARHSRARLVTVAFRVEGKSFSVEVADDGSGFDPARTGLPEAEGRGLENMRVRAEALGGRLEVESSPGSGTRLSVARLPFPLGTAGAA
ncbi:MAG TPA: ATP-binding protein, partial [Thermoanaerobaculia bacterium]|nr:ATP-binding protein [Thermoanaerobaculia bacterium]